MQTEDRAPELWPDLWDVVVIGTGMGGGTLGHTLTQLGHRVLFLEKGHAAIETHPGGHLEDRTLRLGYGQWPDPITANIDGTALETFISLGCGVGGSTLTYGAALERFDPIDFEDVHDGEHPAEGWPIGYDDLCPYYDRAEALYSVCGTRDPLGPPNGPAIRRPPPASPQDGMFMRDLAAAGLNPYRLHVGIEYKPGCVECVGVRCPIACKKDAANSAVEPAVAQGATLWADCEVERLDADASKVTSVQFRRNGGEPERVSARIVVLSAGAYRSPALLLLSANENWPAGLANKTDMVGRYLTLHGGSAFALWPRTRASTAGPRKTIAFRDFYHLDGERLGEVQSLGLGAGYGNILMFLYTAFERSGFRHFPFLRPLLRLPAKVAAKLFGPATIFALILEDVPRPGNRVELAPGNDGKIRIRYSVSETLRRRTRLAKKKIGERLSSFRLFHLGATEIELNYGHASGSCRMGTDPATSVVDRDCRAHGVDNLYVVDGSFLPSGGGTNPSLTIAANAIRVGEIIDRRLRDGTA